MGHTCCSVHDCTIPLADQQDWFCPAHESLKSQCCIYNCRMEAESGHLTCSMPLHRAFEKSREANPALFTLRRRLDRAGLSEIPSVHGIPTETSSQSLGELSSGEPRQSSASTNLPKGRMSRRWTHNEQLFVRPCEVIISRATFFGSEGVSGVKVSSMMGNIITALMQFIT